MWGSHLPVHPSNPRVSVELSSTTGGALAAPQQNVKSGECAVVGSLELCFPPESGCYETSKSRLYLTQS
jgi:hypothetical protein